MDVMEATVINAEKIINVLRAVTPAGQEILELKVETSMCRYPVIVERVARECGDAGESTSIDLKFSVQRDEAVFTKEEYAKFGDEAFSFVVRFNEVCGCPVYSIKEFTMKNNTSYDPPITRPTVAREFQSCIELIGRGLGLDVEREISRFR